MHTGLGQWGLIKWYNASEIKKFELIQDGANARDKALHSKKMKKGIADLKARGAHYGKPPQITEEMWNLAVKLFADEGRSTAYVYENILEIVPDGEKPFRKTALQNRKQQFLKREPYPPSWRSYFDYRKKLLIAKDQSDTKLRAVK